VHQDFKNFEAIAIDNCSSDNSVDLFKNYTVKLIQNAKNYGYGEGINTGIREAVGKYIFLLNIDTRIQPDALGKLYHFMEDNPNVGAAMGKLLIGQSNRINSCGNCMNILGHTWCVGLNEEDNDQYPTREVNSVSGACFFVRKEALDRIGLLDREMFLYNEDADLTLRMLMLGYRLWFFKEAVVEHDYSVSVTQKTKYYYAERNRLVLLLKNFEWNTLLRLSPLLCFQELGILGYAITHGLFLGKLKGYYWFVKQLPHTLRKRRWVQTNRTMPDKDILPNLEITFEYSDIQSVLITWILNPVTRFYCSIFCRSFVSRESRESK